jgi:hypothetical protein
MKKIHQVASEGDVFTLGSKAKFYDNNHKYSYATNSDLYQIEDLLNKHNIEEIELVWDDKEGKTITFTLTKAGKFKAISVDGYKRELLEDVGALDVFFYDWEVSIGFCKIIYNAIKEQFDIHLKEIEAKNE